MVKSIQDFNMQKSKRNHNPEKAAIYRSRHNDKQRKLIKNGDISTIAKYVCYNSKNADKRANRTYDLTVSQVINIIAKPCIYCGEDNLPRALDRIDNSKGHTFDNVNSCCSRCNYTRANMPYLAWLIVAKGMRKARELGLFGSWSDSNGRHPAPRAGALTRLSYTPKTRTPARGGRSFGRPGRSSPRRANTRGTTLTRKTGSRAAVVAGAWCACSCTKT
jgi:hypothetical protein